MKKNLLIMMMMVLCAGFVSAQTINTVRGFVPGGSTGTEETYGVFGMPFGGIQPMDEFYEVSASLAQMQLVTDTVIVYLSWNDSYDLNGFELTADSIHTLLEEQTPDCPAQGLHGFIEHQMNNAAQYNYDSLVVLNVYVCPEFPEGTDNQYEVIVLNNRCWMKSNLRTETVLCSSTLDDFGQGNGPVQEVTNSLNPMQYKSELNEVTDNDLPTYGYLYNWADATQNQACNEEGFIQGICPCDWHLPTAEEVEPLFVLPAENLRVNGNWIVNGNNNLTGFSAEPAGFFNSTTNRFEGLFSETNFWYVSDCQTLTPGVLQLTYYCNTPLNPNRNENDGLSVRCVYDIEKAFEKCEEPIGPVVSRR